jgi:hypothetical protein
MRISPRLSSSLDECQIRRENRPRLYHHLQIDDTLHFSVYWKMVEFRPYSSKVPEQSHHIYSVQGVPDCAVAAHARDPAHKHHNHHDGGCHKMIKAIRCSANQDRIRDFVNAVNFGKGFVSLRPGSSAARPFFCQICRNIKFLEASKKFHQGEPLFPPSK